MSKTVLQLLAIAGTLDILTAQDIIIDPGNEELRWLESGRCGPRHLLPNEKPGQCNPYVEESCCNLMSGWCGSTPEFCSCRACVDWKGKRKPVITSAHTTLPPTGKRNYTVYRSHFADRQCPQIGLYQGKLNSWCKQKCDKTPGCTAVNVDIDINNIDRNVCSLRACGLDPPYPIADGPGHQCYSLKPIAKNYSRYSGPQDKKYSKSQGCIHLPPTHKNQSYIECQETCDGEDFCIGFNFNLKTFDCDMFYCDDPFQTKGVVEENWESWARIKYSEGYNGPVFKYYTVSQGCIHIHPTHGNTTYAGCEKLCDEEPYCLGFNIHIKTLTCELYYCKDPRTPPKGNKLRNWKSYSKRTFKIPLPRLYIEIETPINQSHDKACRLIEKYKTEKSLAACQERCDIEHRLCKGFYFNSDVEVGCILQTCRQKSPFPKVRERGWKGYVVQRHDQGWSTLKMACINDTPYLTVRDSEMSNCQDLCKRDQEDGIACKSISYNVSSNTCKFSLDGSTSDNYMQPCDGHYYTEILDNGISTPPFTGPRNYNNYTRKYFLQWQCPFLANFDDKSIGGCQFLCDRYPNCTAINYGYKLHADSEEHMKAPPNECSLYACGNSPPNPLGRQNNLLRFKSFSLKKDIRDDGAINVKIIDSSKTHRAYLGPEMVLDGSNSTFWNPEPDHSGCYITFKLGYKYKLTKMHLSNYGDGKHDVTQFKLEISYDNVRWYLGLENNVTAGTNESQTFEDFKVSIGEFLRFTVTNTSGYQPWITELGFWGLSEEGFAPYDGPNDKYYIKDSGCQQVETTYRNITYVECEEYCDNEHYCTGFNFEKATGNCELWFCSNDFNSRTPLGVDKSDIRSWRKNDNRVISPHSYNILHGSDGKSYSNKQCRTLGGINNGEKDTCKRHCDLTAQCTAFNFHDSRGCVLRACGQHPPHPTGEAGGWQGYVLEETKRNYGNSWYYGPTKDHSFSGVAECFKVKVLRNKAVNLVECEEACDTDPWCTGFDYEEHKQSGPICVLYVCDSIRTRPKRKKGIESWSKYGFVERGHECNNGETNSTLDGCIRCFCFGGRWDCINDNYDDNVKNCRPPKSPETKGYFQISNPFPFPVFLYQYRLPIVRPGRPGRR